MLFWKPKKKKKQTEEEILQEAFAAVKGQQGKRTVRKRRASLWRKYADPRILVALGVVFVVLIADAVRRENMEFYATVTQVQGSARARLAKGGSAVAAEEGLKLEDGGEVTTGANSWVALSFPDGSAVTLAPNSHFQVHLLEYNRGGQWRGRAFSLLAGQMWARVSPKFGKESRCKVHTPSSVAAVRGTRFYVMYDPGNQNTQVACAEGLVNVDGFQGRSAAVARGGTTTVAYGRPPERLRTMDPGTRNTFTQAPLNEEIKPDSWLKTFELKVTCVLDAPLSILGIGKAGWAVGAADYARRAAAMEALRYMHAQVTGYTTYPDFVDPYTIKELGFPPEDALRVLGSLDGRCIEKYEKTSRGFVIYARARDKARSPYMLTPYGVEPAPEEDMP